MIGGCFPDGGRPEPARKDQECGLERRKWGRCGDCQRPQPRACDSAPGFDRLFRYALKKYPMHVEAKDDHRLSGNHHKRQPPCDHQTHGESHCYGGRRLHQKSLSVSHQDRIHKADYLSNFVDLIALNRE
ncbi:hypothetical protein HPP92_004731 [Vanilla planifolia]|uniref:Uncharacterized protein n=1 Tax=Vanilla planifolia TaxID=51239 RepID=A0A835VBF6_VANPL|nr:hypothetical protein HPP92_004731 [Vanilla planifolia]